MKKFSQFILAAVIIGSVLTTATAAESLSVLLQKGIFAEETEGNLDAAIKIYQQITAEAATNRPVVAQAQYRLGVCYQKKGNKEQAISILNDLLKQFPAEAALGQKARELLAGLGATVGEAAPAMVVRRVLPDASGIGEVLTADGKYIRGLDWSTGDVVQYEVASGQTSRITNSVPWGQAERYSQYRQQMFSRDGRQIAYELKWDPELQIRNLDGSGLRTLCNDRAFNVLPLDWSPDAGSILALRIRRNGTAEQELTLVSTTDGSLRVLRTVTPHFRLLKRASFSPDGRFIAFSSAGEGSPPHSDVFLMTADGRNEVVVAGHPAEDHLLGWTPDGRSLVFLSDRTATWDIWTVHITGGKQQGAPELLKKDFGYHVWDVLGFAADGSFYYKPCTSLGGLYTGEVDLETGKVILPPAPVTTRYAGSASGPTWSTDGSNLLYVSSLGTVGAGNNILAIRSAATGEERFLSPRLSFLGWPSWTPDGRSVIAVGFLGAREGGIFRIDTETNGITRLADVGLVPKLCPDGKTLVFVKDGGEIMRKRNLDTGEESEVVKTSNYPFDLSPDGREVVFQVDGAVKTVSLNGGEPRELFRGLAKRYDLRWTRDGRYIIARATGTASSEIWRVPAQGGTPLKLDLSVPKMDDFTLNPDNRRFAFSVDEGFNEELWVMEGLMPKPAAQSDGMAIRRVLPDASGIGEVLTADGKYICRISGGTGDVVQYEVASGRTSRITNREPWSGKGETLGVPAFSRDGKQIAYDRSSEDSVAQVRVRNLDGSGLRTLYSQKEVTVLPLDWSPDAGSILAFREGKEADELMLISTADGSVRVLRAIPSAEWRLIQTASFSPDGRFIAFSSLSEGSPPHGDVRLMTADGRNEAVVAGHPAMDGLLGWSSDGSSLVFLSDRSGTWDLWTVHLTGGKQQGEPELVKKDFGYDAEILGFAPDGSFYYKTVTSSGRLYHGELDLETGKVLVPPAPVTTRYTGPAANLTWSPDGTKLLYVSNWGFGPGKAILTVRSTATGEERFLSPRLRFVNQISWAPDGRSVIAKGITEKTEAGIFRIDAETSGITRLADGGLFPKLCPDGKTLVSADGPIIKKRNLDTGEESEVVNEGTGGTAQWLYDLSPDGREVVFQAKDAIKTVSLNGGEPRELFRGSAQRCRLRWTTDGRYIIAQARDAASSEIWRVPAQGGTPLKLDLSVPKLTFFALHPDNRRFAFSVNGESKIELWVLENFLPKGRQAAN